MFRYLPGKPLDGEGPQYLRQIPLILGIWLFRAEIAEAGILSAHGAMRCNASGDYAEDCQALKPSRFEGKFGVMVGLDGALSFRTPTDASTLYEGPGPATGTSNPSKITTPIKINRSSGLKFGPTVRIHLVDWIGLGLDAGVEGAVLGTESDNEQQPAATQTSFSISYGASYVGASLFMPVQKIDRMGFFLSTRRIFAKEGSASLRLPFGQESEFKAESLTPIKEVSVGLFLTVLYISYTVREESWQVIETATEKFSPIKSRSSGIELGLSGPIWHIFP